MDCGCLSISLSVCLALTVPKRHRNLSYWLSEAEPRFLIGLQRRPVGPLLLFGQLIDLLALAAGCVSLNLIPEFICWRRACTEMM